MLETTRRDHAGAAWTGTDLRRTILEQSRRANVGHIGSSLSIVEILAALYLGPLRPGIAGSAGGNKLVLSKGHAALALYAVLHHSGRLSADELDTYCADGTLLGVHPVDALEAVDFSSGSLGQGLPVAVGAALANRLLGSSARVYVVMSDAECNEGSVWEAAMFAAHHRLDNLVAVLDWNGQQALGYTDQILDLTPIAEKWSSFGWTVSDVDGHDVEALRAAVEAHHVAHHRPLMVIARTTFGKGVAFMEGKIPWHYLPLDAEQYQAALEGLT